MYHLYVYICVLPTIWIMLWSLCFLYCLLNFTMWYLYIAQKASPRPCHIQDFVMIMPICSLFNVKSCQFFYHDYVDFISVLHEHVKVCVMTMSICHDNVNFVNIIMYFGPVAFVYKINFLFCSVKKMYWQTQCIWHDNVYINVLTNSICMLWQCLYKCLNKLNLYVMIMLIKLMYVMIMIMLMSWQCQCV